MSNLQMIVLDTNILIYYAAGDVGVSEFLLKRLERGDKIFIPTIVIIEFLAYPLLSPQQRAFFLGLLQQLDIVSLDLELAIKAASLRANYGLKLGDSVVAATALFFGVPLVTRNTRDFKKIPQLDITHL